MALSPRDRFTDAKAMRDAIVAAGGASDPSISGVAREA
jgi:hypothetical protein